MVAHIELTATHPSEWLFAFEMVPPFFPPFLGSALSMSQAHEERLLHVDRPESVDWRR